MKTSYTTPFSAVSLGALLAAGGVMTPSTDISHMGIASAGYTLPHTGSTYTRPVWKLVPAEHLPLHFETIVADFFSTLSKNQTQLPQEIEQLLDENSWELYSRTA